MCKDPQQKEKYNSRYQDRRNDNCGDRCFYKLFLLEGRYQCGYGICDEYELSDFDDKSEVLGEGSFLYAFIRIYEYEGDSTEKCYISEEKDDKGYEKTCEDHEERYDDVAQYPHEAYGKPCKIVGDHAVPYEHRRIKEVISVDLVS